VDRIPTIPTGARSLNLFEKISGFCQKYQIVLVNDRTALS
jgi:hypothetical protein